MKATEVAKRLQALAAELAEAKGASEQGTSEKIEVVHDELINLANELSTHAKDVRAVRRHKRTVARRPDRDSPE